MKKTLCLALLGLAPLIAEPISTEERHRAINDLENSRKHFLASIMSLSEAQWNFKPSPERWSIAECAEHIAVSEETIFGMTTKLLASPASAEKDLKAAAARDEVIVKALTDRSQKAKAPEVLQPKRRWASRDELVRAFNERRDSTVRFLHTTKDDLRAHSAPHPVFKAMDAYQWVLLIAAHAERHTAQINEVKTDPNYPKR